MKKLRVTLNGKIYELTVEVLEDDEQYVTGSNMPSPLPPPPTGRRKNAEAAAPSPGPASPPAAAKAAGKVDPDTILAPIAGTVQKVFVQAGTHVEEKTPVVMLDAMKMDTYIYAPRTGDVAEVCVSPGDSVQVGTCLIRYRAGA
jgi:glutaconyl-CoA/methylmalonyl-CoA decarboxylase subunit gamma